MALRGQCDEVAAGDDEGKLRKVLEGYERALSERPENLVHSPIYFLPSLPYYCYNGRNWWLGCAISQSTKVDAMISCLLTVYT